MTKKVLKYLQGTKDLMLIYWCTDTLEVVGFSDSDYASGWMIKSPLLVISL